MAEPLPVAILVEDERQIRRFVRTALEAEGWSVHETDTLRQGLIDAGTRKPDLIILDLGCLTATAWSSCVICAAGPRCR
jgi:two-component system KDP operon response regulator KdpE